MSLERAKAFLQQAVGDTTLQARIDTAHSDGKAAVALGIGLGFEFSVEELNTAIDEMFGDLSDDELASAAGGTTGKWTPIEFDP